MVVTMALIFFFFLLVVVDGPWCIEQNPSSPCNASYFFTQIQPLFLPDPTKNSYLGREPCAMFLRKGVLAAGQNLIFDDF